MIWAFTGKTKKIIKKVKNKFSDKVIFWYDFNINDKNACDKQNQMINNELYINSIK